MPDFVHPETGELLATQDDQSMTEQSRSESVTVYVLDVGAYDERGVRGVFSTPEEGMKAHNPKPHKDFKAYYHRQKPPSWEWGKGKDGLWYFDADSTNCASLDPYELDVYV